MVPLPQLFPDTPHLPTHLTPGLLSLYKNKPEFKNKEKTQETQTYTKSKTVLYKPKTCKTKK